MSTNPTTVELVRAVRAFMGETARPALEGHAAFYARIAENALAIVERELCLSAQSDAAAKDRLRVLLDSSLEERRDLETLLCDRIRKGSLDWQSTALMAHLKASTIDQVKIDQPKYSGLAIATESD
ncbi:MAG: DUF6285 domain-containing protein [Pseudomonadota bacterium]